MSSSSVVCADCGAPEPPLPSTRTLPLLESVRERARVQFSQWYTGGLGAPVVTVCDACYARRAAARQTAEIDDVRRALARPDVSHASARSWCGRDQLFVYVTDPTSPSGCRYLAGCDDVPAARAVVAAAERQVQAAGQRGEASARAAMRTARSWL